MTQCDACPLASLLEAERLVTAIADVADGEAPATLVDDRPAHLVGHEGLVLVVQEEDVPHVTERYEQGPETRAPREPIADLTAAHDVVVRRRATVDDDRTGLDTPGA